jgi:HrpA-like RNA helicase
MAFWWSEERALKTLLRLVIGFVVVLAGCGKSSQVPQILLESGVCDSILCTQPRRLAVVALAKRMAEEMGCEVGGKVGYHIGQRNMSTSQ